MCLACVDKDTDRVDRLALYFREELRLRNKLADPSVREDSLAAIRAKYRIDPGPELKRLQEKPEQWLRLLKDLKRDR
ncbi:MAG: hypothetical protein JSU64_05285 [candidate division WOR-3 bacterium]|nr:MAG: hypothetical protein JSU64_05285 [candidate division WOR-3 bacterium]